MVEIMSGLKKSRLIWCLSYLLHNFYSTLTLMETLNNTDSGSALKTHYNVQILKQPMIIIAYNSIRFKR